MEEFNFLTWLGHASFKIEDIETNSVFYYIDPFQLPKIMYDPADAIFITHTHYDHFSVNDIKNLLKEDTVIVGPKDCTPNIVQKRFEVAPNKKYEINRIQFSTLPAYNLHSERLSFHPKENGWVGYIFNVNGKKIYHAGDTDFIPEMENLEKENIDLALLPIGGTYTMDTVEAIEAANAISAKFTAPIHYKGLLKEKSLVEEEKFKNGVKNSKVIILKDLSD